MERKEKVVRNCDVRAYGAMGDGVAKDTQTIQAAIDDCSSHGGGRVTLAEGRFLCGWIDLKSGVELSEETTLVRI